MRSTMSMGSTRGMRTTMDKGKYISIWRWRKSYNKMAKGQIVGAYNGISDMPRVINA